MDFLSFKLPPLETSEDFGIGNYIHIREQSVKNKEKFSKLKNNILHHALGVAPALRMNIFENYIPNLDFLIFKLYPLKNGFFEPLASVFKQGIAYCYMH